MSVTPKISVSPDGEKLLLAALTHNSAAIDAFHAWTEMVDIDTHFDAGTYRLLPLLYKNLERLSVEHPLMGRLRGLYRRSWYRNQHSTARLGEIITTLGTTGIETMLLGGTALVASAYKHVGSRYADALDVLVPCENAEASLESLSRIGWRVEAESTGIPVSRGHVTLSNAGGDLCHLHWHPLYDSAALDSMRFWRCARPIALDSTGTSVPAVDDLLIQLLVHRQRRRQNLMCWLADAQTLITASEPAWPRLLETARQNSLAARLEQLLVFLRNHLGTPIPASVIQELQASRTSLVERLEQRLVEDMEREREPFFHPARAVTSAFLRHRMGANLGESITSIPDFLRKYYESPSYARIAGRLCINGLRRVGRGVGHMVQRLTGQPHIRPPRTSESLGSRILH